MSVVIPVFNGSEHLEEAVRSVMGSSYRNFEILLIDDGSKDRSKAICRELTRQYKRVNFYSFKRNKGLGRVLNFALNKARGEYICRLNQDDLMHRNRLKVQVAFLQRNLEVVAVGSYIKLFRDSKSTHEIIRFQKTDEAIKAIWYIVGPFADPSVMYRRKVALTVGGYDQAMWPADDTHLWYRMGKVGRLANIPRVLAEVRFHKDAASVKYWRKLALSTYKMHRWTHDYLKSASLSVQLYWLVQLFSGLVFSAEFNWAVYRLLKKMLYEASELFAFWRRMSLNPMITVKKVVIQPKMASRSGQ